MFCSVGFSFVACIVGTYITDFLLETAGWVLVKTSFEVDLGDAGFELETAVDGNLS